LRFYDVTNGAITIDGIDIRDFGLQYLRQNISLVSQDVKLFDASILDNIRYTKPEATVEEVLEAAHMANVDEFVKNLTYQYDTLVGHDGVLLSGGQKQRISIARALLKNSPLLLLDEATSALDPVSEDLIQKSLEVLVKGKTTIIIAHRLSTIVNCDHIFVFENGQLMEEGNHRELVELGGVYRNFCDKQFKISRQV
jgi:ABC-type multidrug transport system fused ATPase/permease subunit